MQMRAFVVAVVVSGLVSAANISPQCQAAIASVAESSAAACLNPVGLVGIFTAGNNSVIPAVKTWLTGTCALDACTNSSLSTITTDVLNGCGQDIGVTSSEIPAIVQVVEKAYPTIRKVICLAHTSGSTSTLCAVEGLTDLQAIVGTLSLAEIEYLLSNLDTLPPPPQTLVCTDCHKEAYNILKKELPSTVANLTTPLETECGASFVDGQTPSDITETASGAQL